MSARGSLLVRTRATAEASTSSGAIGFGSDASSSSLRPTGLSNGPGFCALSPGAAALAPAALAPAARSRSPGSQPRVPAPAAGAHPQSRASASAVWACAFVDLSFGDKVIARSWPRRGLHRGRAN
eukprot:CAMPEP_0171099910 /NCGR_PEP_ID=MMETSP0766_2-20121228/52647_1 /TAXON_ID=439317 /ORGANISM="Gambierdiscus australes, Strain CAWD 149" /LENGTH=124 /DNA_ID=CAMNT_0011559643 /DNA_START=167 /DNA_END=539 /DNA_ORIENTATION=-